MNRDEPLDGMNYRRRVWFLAECHQCGGPAQPFGEWEDRRDWVKEHHEGTGHSISLVTDVRYVPLSPRADTDEDQSELAEQLYENKRLRHSMTLDLWTALGYNPDSFDKYYNPSEQPVWEGLLRDIAGLKQAWEEDHR